MDIEVKDFKGIEDSNIINIIAIKEWEGDLDIYGVQENMHLLEEENLWWKLKYTDNHHQGDILLIDLKT